jgi:hypothetical protein
LRLKRLPFEVTEALGVQGHKEAAPYLKKVQELHCDRLTYHTMCPMQCHRCAGRLLQMADSLEETSIALWHYVVANETAGTIERETERRKHSSAGMARQMFINVEAIRGTLEESGARDREAIGREEDTPTRS